ncbi:MAG: hypothetical protein EA349_05860 [Halomonadaceae bacterium]|nr:MAG: hypothetical protein EA349_05860 [Halomonadaceae bacterium]
MKAVCRYGDVADRLPLGVPMNKGLTVSTGQTHVQHCLKPQLERIEHQDIDHSFVISHHLMLDDAPNAYRMFRDKTDHCTKVVIHPGMKAKA